MARIDRPGAIGRRARDGAPPRSSRDRLPAWRRERRASRRCAWRRARCGCGGRAAADAASGEWASLGALAAHVVLAHVSEQDASRGGGDGDGDGGGGDVGGGGAPRVVRGVGGALRGTGAAATVPKKCRLNCRQDRFRARKRIVRRFETAAATVCHAPFRSVAETLVAPLVASLAAGAEAHRARVAEEDVFSFSTTFVTGASALRELESARRDRTRRGAAWVLLGLARLNLLLPDGTPDPAAAAAATLASKTEALALETNPALAAMAWQSAAPTIANPPRSALAAATLAKATLETDIDRLRTQAAPRPSPPKWTRCAEAAAFRDRLGGVERVLGLARGLGGIFLRDSTFSSVEPTRSGAYAHAGSASDLARARSEARAWLEAARAWEERLELNFRGYRDLTEPLRLSVCEMRRGVALLLASAPDPADDADVARELERGEAVSSRPPSSVSADFAAASAAAASAAAAHLLSFPHSR